MSGRSCQDASVVICDSTRQSKFSGQYQAKQEQPCCTMLVLRSTRCPMAQTPRVHPLIFKAAFSGATTKISVVCGQRCRNSIGLSPLSSDVAETSPGRGSPRTRSRAELLSNGEQLAITPYGWRFTLDSEPVAMLLFSFRSSLRIYGYWVYDFSCTRASLTSLARLRFRFSLSQCLGSWLWQRSVIYIAFRMSSLLRTGSVMTRCTGAVGRVSRSQLRTSFGATTRTPSSSRAKRTRLDNTDRAAPLS